MIKQMSKFFPSLIIIVLFITLVFLFASKTQAQTDSETTTLIVDVQPMIAISLSSYTYDFGNLSANTPKTGPNGITAGVTTNGENGYNLSINDNILSPNSAMVHADTVTYIPDLPALITNPSFWNHGVSKGLGMTVYSADTDKEAKWGTGTTFDDELNKYAGIPEDATIIHTSPNYKNNEDRTGVAFKIDVDTGQKTGIYSGNIILSATANL